VIINIYISAKIIKIIQGPIEAKQLF